VHGFFRLVVCCFGFDDNTRVGVDEGSSEGVAITIGVGVGVGVGDGETTESIVVGGGDVLAATNKAITMSKYITAIPSMDR
jgi:hypothetical protein